MKSKTYLKTRRRLISALFSLVFVLGLALLIGGCGSVGGGDSLSSGSSSGASSGTSVGTTGIAVDPYLVGAVFEEVGVDRTTVLQRQSSPSDSLGRFTFPQAVSNRSTIQLKIGQPGLHAGAPFEGMLKRHVESGAVNNLVVSPLTTLVANGDSEESIIAEFAAAGLSGLSRQNIYDDPMLGLGHLTGQINDTDLLLLQANMAANLLLQVNQTDSPMTATLLADNRVPLAELVTAIKTTLNPALFEDLALAIRTESGSPLVLGDLIKGAARAQIVIINRIKEELIQTGANLPPGRVNLIADESLNDLGQLVRDFAGQNQQNNNSNLVDGAVVFTQHCAGCHNLNDGGPFDLRGDGSRVPDIFSADAPGHLGIMLTASEIPALSNYLNGTTTSAQPPANEAPPVTDSPVIAPATDGSALYTSECMGCHGPTSNGNLAGRSSQQIADAIDSNVGNMGFLNLSNAELQAIAAVLATVEPAPDEPIAPRIGQQVYDQICAVCHSVTGHDGTGSPDLAGKGNLVPAKLAAGHYSNNVATTEVTPLASFLNQFTASAPAPDFSNCTACHGQPPSGNQFPNTAGAHAAHINLSGINGNCAACHDGADHNGWVDLAFTPSFNATSGAATDNLDGTCSNISCHGGQQTPDWQTGSINVNTQCAACHTRGTTMYNSFNSGEHRKHVESERLSCSVCHDTARLATGHFSNLGTPNFEQDPAQTIKASLGYNGNTCSTAGCHGSEPW